MTNDSVVKNSRDSSSRTSKIVVSVGSYIMAEEHKCLDRRHTLPQRAGLLQVDRPDGCNEPQEASWRASDPEYPVLHIEIE